MKSENPIASPRTHRRVWRRVWLGVGIFLLVTPMLMWLVVDFSGKRAWREVRARLQAAGEATTISELNLPDRDAVPDAQNFCAIPWLMADVDGSESQAMAEMEAALEVFAAHGAGSDERRRAFGNAVIGVPSNLSVWAECLDATALKIGRKVIAVEEGNAMDRIAAYLEAGRNAKIWADLDAARTRPVAHFLPIYEQRVKAVGGSPWSVPEPMMTLTTPGIRALSARAIVALHEGDHETVLRCLEISSKLSQGFGNEPSLTCFFAAQMFFSESLETLMECSWSPDWMGDADALLRCQQVLERWDFASLTAAGVRGELAATFYTIEWLKRAGAKEFAEVWGSNARWEGMLLGAAPAGWFDNNAAYAGDLFGRHLLPTLNDREFVPMIRAAKRMDEELMALNSLEEINLHLVELLVLRPGRLIRYAAYGEAYRRMAITVCALHRYRLAHGGVFPERLEELLPGYIDAMPVDPMDGLPLRYERSNEEPGGFRLYSIGYDASDDGGMVNFDPERPYRSRLNRDSYVGDWPWPVVPIDMEQLSADQDAPGK